MVGYQVYICPPAGYTMEQLIERLRRNGGCKVRLEIVDNDTLQVDEDAEWPDEIGRAHV